MSDPWTLTARWIIPVDGPPLEHGTITIRADRIEAVELAGMRTADTDLGNVAILPGFVNSHTHLDLSGMRGKCPPTDPDHFTDWLTDVIAFRRSRSLEVTQADIREGLFDCLQYGTTLLGDIAAEGQSWNVLATLTLLRAVVFRELIGLSKERADAAFEAAATWLRQMVDTPTCRKAVSPHAPYSVRLDLFSSCCSHDNPPLAIHIAESPAELQLFQSKTGPFVKFLNSVGAWDPSGFARGLESFLIRSRLAGNFLLVHCNYMPQDCCKYVTPLHTIIYCPRTHAAFGHPPHPFREFLKRGVRVALGTDSLASNPDLDILAEARFVHERYPDFPADQLLRMITLSGAEALGWADETGSLTPGKSADLVVLPLPDREGDPCTLVLESATKVKAVLFRGEWTVNAKE